MSKSNTVKRGPGRPAEFVGTKKKAIVRVIREMGLTKGREFLATTGVQVTPGKPKELVSISMPTLGKLAKEAKIKLFRGRPKLAA
jgi:hypothetical protein